MSVKCKCSHADWDHYKGKCYGFMPDGSTCKCSKWRPVGETMDKNENEKNDKTETTEITEHDVREVSEVLKPAVEDPAERYQVESPEIETTVERTETKTTETTETDDDIPVED